MRKEIGRRVGSPDGACTSAGWSPDGSWMYFTAATDAQSHLWRQRFPNGQPEQITSGPTEEEGIAVERDGRSIITSLGVHESTIWIHDEHGERSMSSEGEVIASTPPAFSADGKTLYYLLRRTTAGGGAELWRMNASSGASEVVFPGVFITGYDVSPDGKQVVYSTARGGKASLLWIASVDREAPPKLIGDSGETSPYFDLDGKILFSVSEGNVNYMERMNPDGSGRARVIELPDQRGSSHLSGAPMGDGRPFAEGWKGSRGGRDSDGRWAYPRCLRELLSDNVVAERKISLYFRRGAIPGNSRA